MPSSRLLLPALLTVAVCGLSGCGKGGSGNASPAPQPSPTSSGSTAPSPTTSHSPEPSASPSAPAPTPTTTPDPATLLLPASGLPGFNEQWDWSAGRTGPERGPIGICQRLTLQTLGADKSVTRHYLPTGDETGGTADHVVAQFVDDKSVAQAIAVLRSWHDKCGDRLAAYGTKKVGPITPVSTDKGTAWRYLVTYAKKGADSGTFDDIGVLRSGTTVELVLLRLHGQDFAQTDPMDQALRNAADRLP